MSRERRIKEKHCLEKESLFIKSSNKNLIMSYMNRKESRNEWNGRRESYKDTLA
jgi:hypothetical protein